MASKDRSSRLHDQHEWKDIEDRDERRRVQNRDAQRRRRKYPQVSSMSAILFFHHRMLIYFQR